MMLKGNHNRKGCELIRERIEAGRAATGADALVDRHVATCRECAQYAQLEQWSRQVLLAGEVPATAPLMSAVWASIHRASEQAWDSALTRSFRYLLPYMVALVALVVLVGTLASPRTQSVQAASSAFAVLNQPEAAAVVNVMSSDNLPSEDPAKFMGVGRPR